MLRAEKGTGLESFFAGHHQPPDPLLPVGFQKQTALTLSAVGDLMNNKALGNSEGVFYKEVADLIFDVDVSFANMESTLTDGPVEEATLSMDDLPKINATPEQFNAFKGHQGRQYTVFQTANNHILDCGMEGFDTTHDTLEAEGYKYVGTNRTAKDQKKGLIIDADGIRLGFVAATWGINNRPFPDGKDYLVNVVRFHRRDGQVDLSLLEEQMAFCRSQACDLVIACLHWGCEWEFFPRKHQVDIAHSLAESGADVIIGHHSHNIQPVEWYRSQRDPHRIIPILYGMGNLAAVDTAPHTVLSLIANLTIAKGQVDGETKTLVEGMEVTPVVQMAYDLQTKPYVRLEVLKDAFHSAAGEKRAYLGQIAGYADLALGTGWRS